MLAMATNLKIIYGSYALITTSTSYGDCIAFLAPFLQHTFDQSEMYVALYFLAFGAVTAVVSPLSGIVIDRGFKTFRVGSLLVGLTATMVFIGSTSISVLENSTTAFVATLVMSSSYSVGFVIALDDLVTLSRILFCGEDQTKYKGAKLVALSWFFLLRSLGRALGSFINGGLFVDLFYFKGALYLQFVWLLSGFFAVCLEPILMKELRND